MRHQLPRPEMTSSSSSTSGGVAGGSGSGASTSTAAGGGGGGGTSNLPGTSGSGGGSGGAVGSSAMATSSTSSSVPPTITPSSVRGGSKPHSVIRTLRQMSMVENSDVRRSSYASPTSASTNSLIANLEAVHTAEMNSVENPASIVRHVVEELGCIIKEMRADSNEQNPGVGGGGASGGFVEDLANCSDVGVLRQRLITVERANHMMTIHLDLMDLQKKLEKAEALKLDDRKSFVIATREELYKEIVELLEAEFSCSICNEVFVSPCVTKCGHTFCELCIKTWTRDKVDCPICRSMIFNDWGKNCEIDNFITRLHLRLSDEIRQSREALVQERVEAVETLRNTPRRNEGAAFVDALRFLRDQQQQGRTTPTSARALAERFRAMRRSAAEANMGNIDEAAVGTSTNDGPTARIRARLQQELEALRQAQQQNAETLNSLSPLSRASGRQSSASSSVARIRVRPSQGVSFTLVAPRSMISSHQPPATAPLTCSNQSMTVRTQVIESPPPTANDTSNREITVSATANEEPGRRVPNVPIGLLMARGGYSRSQPAITRSGLDRAVAHARSQFASRTTSAADTSSAPSASTASITGPAQPPSDSRNEGVDVADDSRTAANAARRIRSIFSDATASPSATGTNAGNSSSSEYPYTSTSSRLDSQANQQQGEPPGVSPDDNLEDNDEQPSPSSIRSLLSPIRSASSEILRAFSERESAILYGSSNLENNSAAETTDPPNPAAETDLEVLDQRLRTGEVSLHDAISAFRLRLERAMGDSGLRNRPETPLQNIVPYDDDDDVDMSSILSSRESAATPTGAQRPNVSSGSNNNLNTTGLLALDDESLDGNHSSLALRSVRPSATTTNEERPPERRVLHRLRESRRRRGERLHREGGGSHSRGRETTITISFCRGDQDRNNGGTGGVEGSQPAHGSGGTVPPTPPLPTPTEGTTRGMTSIVSELEIPANLPIVMDCESDTPSPGPSTSALGRENTEGDSNETQITGNSSAASGYNGTAQAVDDDIEILFSDIEDAGVN